MTRYGNAEYIVKHFGIKGLQDVLNYFSAERGEVGNTATIDDCFTDIEFNVFVGTEREIAEQVKADAFEMTYKELLSDEDKTHNVYERI